jgi:hypothetical protein
MSTTGNEKIGYRNPPKTTQFKKGHSGNPKGRPKGRPNLVTALQKALREKVSINENGRRKVITKGEAAMKQLANKAASGDLHALKHLVMIDRSAEEHSSEPTSTTAVLAEVDQKVLQGIFSRFESNGNGGGDNEPDGK